MQFKIGDLARRTGLTVRTLHHYDKIGLLSPSIRNASGYRLYNRQDLTRLHRILTLKRLNLSLQEIAALIDGQEVSLAQVLQQQVETLAQQIQQAQELQNRLATLSKLIEMDDAEQLDYWLMTLEKMSVMDKYFARDEVDLFMQKNIQKVHQDETALRELLTQLKACQLQGQPSDSALAKGLVQRWQELLSQTLPDPALHSKFIHMHEQEQALHTLGGVDADLVLYMKQAAVATRYDLYREFFSDDELSDFKRNAMRLDPEWINLFSALRQQMQAGASPQAQSVQTLMQRWQTLSLSLWNNRRDLLLRARTAHMQRPALNQGGGLTPELLDFARTAMRYLEHTTST